MMDTFLNACKTGDIRSLAVQVPSISDKRMLQTGLHRAVVAGQIAAIVFLLERGAVIDNTAFGAAAELHSKDVWACFMDLGLDINTLDYEGGVLGISTRDPSLVRWLLERGADPNLRVRPRPECSYEVDAMSAALANNQLESMKILVAHGALLDNELFEPCLAPYLDDEIGVETLQFLLDSGLDPNVTIESRGSTPLQMAVQGNMLDKARALLNAGASVSFHVEHGKTPLEEAQTAGNEAMIKLLTSFGS